MKSSKNKTKKEKVLFTYIPKKADKISLKGTYTLMDRSKGESSVAISLG